MPVEVRVEPISHLAELGDISSSFLVERVLSAVPINDGLGGITFTEVAVDVPWQNDIYAMPERPAQWAIDFDVSNWGLLYAHDRERRVGGAVIAFDTPGVDMLERRTDLAVLWDLRVHPDVRGTGVGTALFHAAEAWARVRGCRHLKIETQNVNVPACRFYRSMGCTVGTIRRFAYPALPDEIALYWYKAL